MGEALLRVENLTVSFEGFRALDGLTLEIAPRAVRALIGPNGAGKSTLLDAIIGRVRPAAGRVVLRDAEITRVSEHNIVRRGVCRKFQTPGVLDGLTVFENLELAASRHKSWWAAIVGRMRPAEREKIEEILRLIGLEEKRDAPAAHLAHGQKQWLEIGMVVASEAELLLLDEPAAGMTHGEAARTAELIRGLAARHTIVVIDHDMAFLEMLEAPVSVLHMGKLIAEGSMEEIRRDARVTAVYLGRAKEAKAPAAAGGGARLALEACPT